MGVYVAMSLERENRDSTDFAYPSCRICDLCACCPAKLAVGKRRSSFVTDHRFPLSRGDHLFKQRNATKALYVLRSGTAKSYVSSPEADADHVVRFHLRGDVIGLDAFGSDDYQCSVQALEMVTVCQIDMSVATDDTGTTRDFDKHLLMLTGRQAVEEQRHMLILSLHDAAERLAIFLLQMSQQYRKRGLSAVDFNLTMSRREIASYLALTVETVSRVFSEFKSLGVIRVDHRRRIRLPSIERLRHMVKPEHLWLVK